MNLIGMVCEISLRLRMWMKQSPANDYTQMNRRAALHNMFVLLVQDEGISGHFSGDGSEYSLSVEQHYRSASCKKGRKYLFTLRIIEVETNFYVGIGF